MREILFRGKNHSGWHYGSLLDCSLKECNEAYIGIYINGEAPGLLGVEWVPVDPGTVGQYTGLKDKNGKRIFEGDIINVRFDFGYGLCDCPAVVVYDEPGFKFKSLAGIDYAVGDLFEIIGNIHENP